jgi:hypothetical protein
MILYQHGFKLLLKPSLHGLVIGKGRPHLLHQSVIQCYVVAAHSFVVLPAKIHIFATMASVCIKKARQTVM